MPTVSFEGETHDEIVRQVRRWLASMDGPESHLSAVQAIDRGAQLTKDALQVIAAAAPGPVADSEVTKALVGAGYELTDGSRRAIVNALNALSDVTGGGVVAHDHVAGLLTTEGVAGDLHRLEHVAVADLGLAHPDAGPLHGLHEAEVAHHGGHDRVLDEPALVAQREGEHGEQLVAVDDGALVVDREAAVGVAVEGEADVGAVLQHRGLQ